MKPSQEQGALPAVQVAVESAVQTWMQAKSMNEQVASAEPPSPVVELELEPPPAPVLLDELEPPPAPALLDELALDDDELADEELLEAVELDEAWVLVVELSLPPPPSRASLVSGFAQLVMMRQAPTSHIPR